MIHQLWYWLNGYLVLRFRGANLEIILNRITDSGLYLWNVERVADNIMIAHIGVGNFAALRSLLWGTRTNVAILDKKGLPFVLNKLKHRQLLLIGLVVVMISLYYLSGFIWFIQVHGNQAIAVDSIMAILSREGLRVGAAKKELNLRKLELVLMTELEDLSWAGITVQGSLLKIQVAERSTPEQETIQYGNIVASKDGLITQVLPFRGTPQVRVGDTVKKGQILISGQYYDLYGRLTRGRSEGIVRARVWYEAIGEAAYSRIVQSTTGITHSNYSITLGKYTFTIGKKPPFQLYQVHPQVSQPVIKGYRLPVAFTKNIYEEIDYETMVVSPEEARVLALDRAWKNLDALGVARESVESYQVEEIVVTDQLGIRVGLIVEVEEDIGQFSPEL